MTELGRDARAILDAARRGAAPTPEQAARVWARLSDVLGTWDGADGRPAPTSGGHVAPAASPHAAVIAPAALVVAAITGVAVVFAIHVGPAPVLPAVTAPSSEVSAPAVSPAPSADAPAPPVAPVVTPVVTPPVTPAVSPSRRPVRRTNDGGHADVALVRSAYEALRDGDPMRALALVEEHARRFPASALAEERDATRILALCATDGQDARAAFERYRRDYPAGVQLRRLPAECAGGVEVPR